jgi:uncharacterized protein (TIGR00730 family)
LEAKGVKVNGNVVSVFGSSQAQTGSLAYREALATGRILATAGLTVCSGGYGGVMEAVSRGAKEAGGKVIAVTTEWFSELTVNAWADEEIRTATFLDREQRIIEVGDAYLALKGGIGTLTEISTVWSLLQTRSIPPRPLVMLADPWQGLVDLCREQLIIRAHDFHHVHLASTPSHAVELVLKALGSEDP